MAGLREGVWINPEDGCSFDDAAASAELPGCAKAMVLSAGVMRSASPDDGETPDFGRDITYLLVSGQPPVMQYGITLKNKPVWVYQGAEPLRTDAQGRITALRIWTAKCGPPPPKSATPDDKTRYVTEHPFPGLTIRESNCIARNAKAVRNAVRESRALDDDQAEIRWLRDEPR